MFRNNAKKHGSQLMFWTAAFIITWLPVLGRADFQDPTKPDYPPPSTSHSDSGSTETAGKWELSAIWITRKGKRATLNGMNVRQGQTLPNKVKIIKITKNTVSLQYNGNIKTLQLLPPYKKPVKPNDTK